MSLFHLVEIDEVTSKVDFLHLVDLLFSRQPSFHVLLDDRSQLVLSLFAHLVHDSDPLGIFPILLNQPSSVNLTLDLVPPIPFGNVLFPAPLNPLNGTDDFGVLHILSYVVFHLVKSKTIDVVISQFDIRNLLSNIF